MSSSLSEWERVEAERSAAEAAHFDLARLRPDETQVARYIDPPADTPYPLEYSFHVLGDVRDKLVLEYGCGDGINSVVLARRCSNVKALDISPDLIGIARKRLAASGGAENVEFIVGSAHDLPMEDESVDVVFGMAILHHLDLELSAREVKRVLRKGGRAIFQEPVRNSKVIKFIRGLIPYRAPDVSPYERPLTDEELAKYAEGFSSCTSRNFRLPTTSLASVLPFVGRRYVKSLYRMDAAILRNVGFLNKYATVRVMELVK